MSQRISVLIRDSKRSM